MVKKVVISLNPKAFITSKIQSTSFVLKFVEYLIMSVIAKLRKKSKIETENIF